MRVRVSVRVQGLVEMVRLRVSDRVRVKIEEQRCVGGLVVMNVRVYHFLFLSSLFSLNLLKKASS